MRDFYPTGQFMDLEDLPKLWAAQDALHKLVVQLPDSHSMTTALTARRFDESQPAGRRVYFEADRLIGVAIDNHRALTALLESHGAGLWAPWSLLRPQFECATIACWILDPDDGRERRRRGLRCEVQDSLEQRKHLRTYEHVTAIRKQVLKTIQERRDATEPVYKAEAAQLGAAWDGYMVQSISTFDVIPTLSFVKAQPGDFFAPMIQATWRMLSGFEHGLGWALMQGAERGAQTKIPGGMEMEFSINDQPFVLAAKTTSMMVMRALSRFEFLHTHAIR